MSRIRSVHPKICTDEAFVSLSFAARTFLMLLWTECDDQGSFEWKPKTLKMELLPADNVDIEELLGELETWNCVMRYTIGGKTYGAVRNFCKYQRPKKPNAVYPQNDEIKAYCCCGSSEPVGNQYGTGGEIEEQMEDGEEDVKGKGKEIMSSELDPAVSVLEYLNLSAGRNHRPVAGTLKFIHARLEEKYQAADFRKVIDHRSALWKHDPKMQEYLRPSTLFTAEKFPQYLEAAERWEGEGRPAPGEKTVIDRYQELRDTA